MDTDQVLMEINKQLGNIDGRLDGIGREIGELKAGISACQTNCRDSRQKVGTRLRVVEDFRKEIIAYAVAASVVISIAGNWVLTRIFGGS